MRSVLKLQRVKRSKHDVHDEFEPCPACSSGALVVERLDYEIAELRADRVSSKIGMYCAACGAVVAVEVTARVTPEPESLVVRARASLEDPEQAARDKRANEVLREAEAVEARARSIRETADKIRRGLL